MAYSFDEFLDKAKDMSWLEIIALGDREGTNADRASHGQGGRVAREAGSLEYAQKLRNFLFFLQHRRRAGGTSDEEFEKYKVVVEALVKKGELKSEILDMFE